MENAPVVGTNAGETGSCHDHIICAGHLCGKGRLHKNGIHDLFPVCGLELTLQHEDNIQHTNTQKSEFPKPDKKKKKLAATVLFFLATGLLQAIHRGEGLHGRHEVLMTLAPRMPPGMVAGGWLVLFHGYLEDHIQNHWGRKSSDRGNFTQVPGFVGRCNL